MQNIHFYLGEIKGSEDEYSFYIEAKTATEAENTSLYNIYLSGMLTSGITVIVTILVTVIVILVVNRRVIKPIMIMERNDIYKYS